MTELLTHVVQGKLDQTRGKEVMEGMLEERITVQAAMDKLGIKEVDGSELESLCQQLIDENQSIATQIRDGNAKAVGALIGQARKLNPNANPGLVRAKILELLGSS